MAITEEPGRIIVVGASAGGVEALIRLGKDMPADLPAAVFVVLHLPASGTSILPEILARRSSLPVSAARHGDPIKAGRIYVAPPNHHLLVKPGYMRLVNGPRENGHRPAIDPLFRTAAQAYRQRVIGVILSGMLDDGTLGLQIVKRMGGLAVVQEPDDALFSPMPQNAINSVAVDHIVPLAEMGALLSALAREPNVNEDEVRGDREATVSYELGGRSVEEGDILEQPVSALESRRLEGKPSMFTCPDCGGVMMENDEGGLLRYRCYTGHAFSDDSLLACQSDALEEALWTALRTLEEQAELSRRLRGRAADRGHERAASQFNTQALEAEARAHLIRSVLLNSHSTAGPAGEPSDVAKA